MKQSNFIIICEIVVSTMLFGCHKTEYNYNCGVAASTPTDLRITNNTTREVQVTLKVKEKQLNEFKQFTLSPDKTVLFCIEYEGPITDGIHIEFENHTTIIKLKPQQLNEFNMNERKVK